MARNFLGPNADPLCILAIRLLLAIAQNPAKPENLPKLEVDLFRHNFKMGGLNLRSIRIICFDVAMRSSEPGD